MKIWHMWIVRCWRGLTVCHLRLPTLMLPPLLLEVPTMWTTYSLLLVRTHRLRFTAFSSILTHVDMPPHKHAVLRGEFQCHSMQILCSHFFSLCSVLVNVLFFLHHYNYCHLHHLYLNDHFPGEPDLAGIMLFSLLQLLWKNFGDKWHRFCGLDGFPSPIPASAPLSVTVLISQC